MLLALVPGAGGVGAVGGVGDRLHRCWRLRGCLLVNKGNHLPEFPHVTRLRQDFKLCKFHLFRL